MEYLLDISETIPAGVGFRYFEPFHLAWLAAGAGFILLCCLVYRRLGRGRRRLQLALAAAIVADELFKLGILLVGNRWNPGYLPLHLCSVNILLIAIHALRPGRVLDNFLYTVCLPGALAALLFPGWTELPGMNLMCIHSFTLHILLAAYPLMLTVGGDIRPRLRDVPGSLGLLLALAGVALLANLRFGTNFMFLMYADRNNPLHLFEEAFGSHLVGFPIIIAGLILVLYGVPYLFGKIKKAGG